MGIVQSKSSIREVARTAGVSIATVSRVLNNSSIPTAMTRARVLQAAQELHYEPDETFRQALRQRRAGQPPTDRRATQTIGFLTPATILRSAQAGDSYYSLVVDGIQRAVGEQQYHFMWETAPLDSPALPRFVMEHRLDGLLIEGTFPAVLRGLLAQRLPVAFIDRTYPELPANSVMKHIERAVPEILGYLWELGHRNVVTFQHACAETHVDVYLRAFHRFFAERNHPLAQPRLCERRETTPATNDRVMAEYARELAEARPRPTALVTGDGYALSLMAEFSRLGLRVPADISIVGMDDVLAARQSSPQLTTYRFPMDEMGRSATELVIEQIQDRHRPVRDLLISGQLFERATCARVTGNQ